MNTSQLKLFLYAGALLVFGVIYGFFFGWAIDGRALVYPLLSAALFVAALLLSATFVRDKKILAAIFLPAFLGVFAMSAKDFSVNYFIAGGVSFAALLVAGFRAMGGSGGSLKISIGRFARLFVPLAITSLAILAAFVYTSNFIGKDFSLPEKSFRSLIAPLELVGRGAIPGFSLDMSVPQLIGAVIEANPPAELKNVPREIKDQFLRESEGQILKTISDALQVPVSRGDSVFSALYRAASAQIVRVPKDLKTPALVVFGFLVFLTLKGFGLIFYYPIVGLAWLLYRGLLASGFIRLTEEDVKREVLSL